MKEILTIDLLQKLLTALEKNEPFAYKDGNTEIRIEPNKAYIKYSNFESSEQEQEQEQENKAVVEFLNYCDTLNDDLFIEVCESFKDDELKQLQDNLDTDKYQESIDTFTTRVEEIAESRLAKIINESTAEIENLEKVIADSYASIESIRKEIKEAYAKYSI